MMENLHYQYILHMNQKHLDEDWDLEERPTTSQPESESLKVSCNVCRRNFRSKKALWGHRRCCKAARAGNRNLISRNESTSLTGFKNDVLESGWSATAKRGRKPVLEITGPESVAAGILVYMSSGKHGDAVPPHDREKRKSEMNESPQFCDSPMAQFTDGNTFMCVICGKVLPSYQALGGHNTSHSKDDMMVNWAQDGKEVKHSKGLTNGDHQCEVCGMSYPSGQALGGHKRKHWTGSSFMPGNRRKASEFPAGVVPCLHWKVYGQITDV